jgi:hypothetical protein
MAQVFNFAVYPSGRIALEMFCGLASRQDRGDADQGVRMIIDATYLESDHAVLASAATDPGPNVVFDFGFDKWGSVLGRENDMKIELRECIGHLSDVNHRYAMGCVFISFSAGFTHGYFKASLRDGNDGRFS